MTRRRRQQDTDQEIDALAGENIVFHIVLGSFLRRMAKTIQGGDALVRESIEDADKVIEAWIMQYGSEARQGHIAAVLKVMQQLRSEVLDEPHAIVVELERIRRTVN